MENPAWLVTKAHKYQHTAEAVGKGDTDFLWQPEGSLRPGAWNIKPPGWMCHPNIPGHERES